MSRFAAVAIGPTGVSDSLGAKTSRALIARLIAPDANTTHSIHAMIISRDDLSIDVYITLIGNFVLLCYIVLETLYIRAIYRWEFMARKLYIYIRSHDFMLYRSGYNNLSGYFERAGNYLHTRGGI